MRRDKELQEGSSVGLKSGLRKKTEKETGEKKKEEKRREKRSEGCQDERRELLSLDVRSREQKSCEERKKKSRLPEEPLPTTFIPWL